MSGIHDSAQSGAGHLLSFLGTDSIHSIDYLEDYYNAAGTFVGGSVPATEHSVMCMGGMDDEFETFRRLIEDVYPSGIVSIVSDTWDFWGVVGLGGFGERLKDTILARRPDAMGMAKTVFRPDSGDPVRIICGYRYTDVASLNADAIASALEAGYDAVRHQGKYFAIEPMGANSSPKLTQLEENEAKGSLECLHDIFGGTVTAKGYKVLNERVGLIYGDSITLERAQAILAGMKAKGFASNNMVFGIGSFTYQYCTRDTFGSAVKATYGVVKGVGRPLFKDPKTDGGTKKSAKGLLRVEKEGDDFVLHEMQTPEQEKTGALRPVFHDGKIENEETVATIRQRLKGG